MTGTRVRPTVMEIPRSRGRGERILALGLTVLGVALFVYGLVVRIWMVDHLPINSDQAVSGLMSLGILHGHLGAITWGQTYGGVEPYVTSVVFALFGHSDTTLNITPVVLSFTASCLVYVIGRRFLPRTLAALGAIAVWVWPAIAFTNGTQELGYRYACLNLGLLAIMCALRLSSRGPSRPRYALVGLVLGLCLWANPECVYFLVPCVVLVSPWILRGWSSDRTRTALELLCAATGVVVGGLPLWWSRFSNPTAAVAPYPGTLATRSDALVTHAAPLGLGFQVPGSGAWLGGEAIGVGVLVALIVAVVLGVTWALVGHQPRTITALVTFVVAYPIIYSLLPGTWYWHDGRYIVYLPYLFIVVALYPLGLLHGRRLVAATTAVIVLGAAAATASELTRAVPGLSARHLPHAFTVSRISLAPLARDLERHRVRLGYAGYWVAYNLDFESGGVLTFTPTDSDVVRNSAYLHEADRARRPAWVLCEPGESRACRHLVGSATVDPPGLTWTSFTSWLDSHGITYTTFSVDGFGVIVPDKKVTPAVVRRAGQTPVVAMMRPERTASTSRA